MKISMSSFVALIIIWHNMPRLGFYIARLSQDLSIEFWAFENYLYRFYRFYLDKVKKSSVYLDKKFLTVNDKPTHNSVKQISVKHCLLLNFSHWIIILLHYWNFTGCLKEEEGEYRSDIVSQ
jgi:hypothetical protein